MEILKTILNRNNPKIEINNIFVDKENMVSTDTTILIVKKHNQDIEKSFLIINDKAKDKLNAEDIVFDEKINYTDANRYPEYKRIVKWNGLKEYIPKYDTLIDVLYEISYKKHIILNFIDYATKFKKINKLLPKINKVSYNGENDPIQITAKNYIIMIMPMYFNKIQNING